MAPIEIQPTIAFAHSRECDFADQRVAVGDSHDPSRAVPPETQERPLHSLSS